MANRANMDGASMNQANATQATADQAYAAEADVKQASIHQALEALKAGEVVAFPTDTVWGVGVAVAYSGGPQAVFAAKRRAADKPVAWLVGGPDALNVYGRDVPDYARNLAAAFWPGALTLVVRASEAVPAAFASAQGTVGLRMAAHSAVARLVQALGPLAASSANLSGQPPVLRAADLDPELLGRVACVLADGDARGDVPGQALASTVVDCTGRVPVVLREGAVIL